MARAVHNPDQLPVHGYWGGVTSTIDWCELNYETTHFLAEFFNATSNVPMMLLALWALYKARSSGLGKRFEILSFLQLLVGIGSFLFHGTLKFEAQLLDELPMVYLGVSFVYCMLEDKARPKYWWLPWVMVTGSILYSLAYIYTNDWVFFVLPFSLLIAPHAVYFLSFRQDWTAIRTGLIGNGLFIVAFIAWQLDQKLCPHAEFLQLHAVWHLITAYSAVMNITLFEYIHWRHNLNCKNARIEYALYCLPMCVVDHRDVAKKLRESKDLTQTRKSRASSSPQSRRRRVTRSSVTQAN